MDLHFPTPFIVSPTKFANFTSVLTRQTQIHLSTSFLFSGKFILRKLSRHIPLRYNCNKYRGEIHVAEA